MKYYNSYGIEISKLKYILGEIIYKLIGFLMFISIIFCLIVIIIITIK